MERIASKLERGDVVVYEGNRVLGRQMFCVRDVTDGGGEFIVLVVQPLKETEPGVCVHSGDVLKRSEMRDELVKVLPFASVTAS